MPRSAIVLHTSRSCHAPPFLWIVLPALKAILHPTRMPRLADRAIHAYRSPIRELEDQAEAVKARGTRVLHLNIGQPDLPTPPEAYQALRDLEPGVLAYGPARGLESYRRALQRYYARWGVTLELDNLNVTTGASEAIWLVINAIADPDDEIIVPEPFYALYNGFLQICGVRVVAVSTKLADGFRLPSAAQFAEAITPRTKAILLCNPGNPTGQVYSPAELAAIGELAEAHNLYVIVDEVYREFVYDGVEFTSALSIEGLQHRAVVIDSVSKRYSACGARIGSVACRDGELMQAITRISRFRLCPPTLGQLMCERILDADESYLDMALAEYDRRRHVLYNGLSTIPGVRCYLPQGAFYCFVELPVDDAEAFARWMLTEFSHEGATVMLAPGVGFYATEGRGRHEVRLAYVINVDDLALAVECLREALVVYNRLALSEVASAAGFLTR